MYGNSNSPSRTIVQTEEKTETVIYLKPKEEEKPPKKKKSVQFAEDTIDNENMNKLKSNLCCIYHKKKINPDDSSSSTCSSDDSGNELERDRITKQAHKKKCSKHKNQKNENNEEKKD